MQSGDWSSDVCSSDLFLQPHWPPFSSPSVWGSLCLERTPERTPCPAPSPPAGLCANVTFSERLSLTSYLSFSLPVSANLDFATQDGNICLYLLTGHLFKASGSLAFWGLPGAPEPQGDSSRLEMASVGWHSALLACQHRNQGGYLDRKSTRLNSSHRIASRMPSSA